MTQIVDTFTDELEIDFISTQAVSQSEQNLQHKREVKRRLDEYFEQMQLNRALGLDD